MNASGIGPVVALCQRSLIRSEPNDLDARQFLVPSPSPSMGRGLRPILQQWDWLEDLEELFRYEARVWYQGLLCQSGHLEVLPTHLRERLPPHLGQPPVHRLWERLAICVH